MEFAVIETGGKQYKVAKGDLVSVEKINDTLKVGDKVVFDKVLLVESGNDTTIGTPYIDKAKVEATLVEIGREAKVIAFRYKAKSNRQKTYGHRQPFMKVEITAIK